MKRIKRTKIVIRHAEGFATKSSNAVHHEFDTCPLCHSVLDRDGDRSAKQIQNNDQPHLLGDGDQAGNGHSDK